MDLSFAIMAVVGFSLGFAVSPLTPQMIAKQRLSFVLAFVNSMVLLIAAKMLAGAVFIDALVFQYWLIGFCAYGVALGTFGYIAYRKHEKKSKKGL